MVRFSDSCTVNSDISVLSQEEKFKSYKEISKTLDLRAFNLIIGNITYYAIEKIAGN
jgi:hypothetical protein